MKATPEPKHWLEYAIFAFVIATAAATGVAAWYTGQQSLTATDTEKRQLRAYISVQPKQLRNFGDSDPVEIFYEIQNSGQTPAFETRFFSTVTIFPYPIPQNSKFPDVLENTTMSKSVIFPKTTYHGVKSTENPLSHDQLEAVRSGQSQRLYFIGIARYADAFKVCHETKYCSSIGGPALRELLDAGGGIADNLFQNCERFNDADYEGVACATDAK